MNKEVKFLSDYEPDTETDFDKQMAGKAIEQEPSFVRKFLRPDGSTVDLRFYKNQFGGYYLSTQDSLGGGQRLHGNIGPEPEDVEEYVKIWSKGLKYKEIT